MSDDLADRIDALLPQTQCTKCGYAGCRPYAEAIARGEADIDQCPPGGAGGVARLARLLGREPKPLNPVHGSEKPLAAALIDEAWCIGCTLCIQACPVDAIVGAAKRMHTVLLERCTGCELCLPPCPVDCIEMVELGELARRGAASVDAGPEERAARARAHYAFRQRRLASERAEHAARLVGRAEEKLHSLERSLAHDIERKRAAIRAALERARARRL
jgi:Na+-translocating ferredoxin:NAD+ oxidoreductase subunit B